MHEVKHLRDRAVLTLVGLHALRTMEITRQLRDLPQHGDSWASLVHGK